MCMESQYLKPGDLVKALAAGGARLTRRVVAVENGRVYVCTDEEYREAARARREPVCVGFRPEVVSQA